MGLALLYVSRRARAHVSEAERTVIEKFAQFVARKGPEYEELTKQQQAGNPKFAFLFGGEHHHYYRCAACCRLCAS